MATKRPRSPGQALIPNPFIKKRNLEWALDVPDDDAQPTHRQAADDDDDDDNAAQPAPPTAAAIESGSATITNHAAHFSAVLAGAALDPWPRAAPRLPVAAYAALYTSCLGAPSGAHFVVHQHDHPVAGTHYDLRLQINGASSASWAVMYGLPGDPGSARLGRNATETRVHCLWNHLVETASRATGSLLVWDTGTYEVLGRRSKSAPEIDPDSERSEDGAEDGRTEQEKLRDAFAERKIREEDREGREKASRSASRAAPQRRRRRMIHKQEVIVETSEEIDSSSSEKEEDEELDDDVLDAREVVSEEESKPLTGPANLSQAMRQEVEELEDAQVRATNAYPGAKNTIGSVHQRRWYLSMDRAASGFVKKRRGGGVKKLFLELEDEQSRGRRHSDIPFYVHGPEVERSLITGVSVVTFSVTRRRGLRRPQGLAPRTALSS
ncbi:conserved hypothetical protein [Verticillium alfalfae VaMs.102]|uniref:DNA ligase D 3'-phosphoesterase domain-containing protein n=1 Tax=Verticillium alfalfae (strain VaMs.102 / ATCC MYA-4576 / FGSC 10136) TaxID=526221 RepID=C9SH93_VERA1|nr:conserved hypothetical protein [Verticillium alfalfae VaMs.102]EEY17687.1 conserved hypothetical protein [Verticillium alfalfae VaMs.102]